MAIQWYPGHMTKTIRQMEEDIRLIDLVIELVDARIPLSSRNPELARLASGRARLIVLNKSDLADERATALWKAYFESDGIGAVCVDSRSNKNVKNTLMPAIRAACAEKIERNRKRGILNRPMRCMIAGIPNVGKSTFINSLAGRATAKTGDRPGVTRGKQWIRLNKECDLLDTPGILWPKIESDFQGENLAFTGAIKDDVLESTDLAMRLIGRLAETAPQAIKERYGIEEELNPEARLAVLNAIALRRGCLKSGGEADADKAAKLLIREFRAGELGRITLELPGKRLNDGSSEVSNE